MTSLNNGHATGIDSLERYLTVNIYKAYLYKAYLYQAYVKEIPIDL